MYIVILYDDRTNKLIPFEYLENGQINPITKEVITIEDLDHFRVDRVLVRDLDLEDGYLIREKHG